MQDKEKRYAYEKYVREMDEWYWKRTQNLVETKGKKVTTLAATNVVLSAVAVFVSGFVLLRK